MIAVRALPLSDPLTSPELWHALRHEHFVWDAYVAGERRVDLHPLVLSPEAHADALAAVRTTLYALAHTKALAFGSDSELGTYGLAPTAARLARASYAANDATSLSRIDLLLGEDGRFRPCEINADCPGGLNEADGLPALLGRAGFPGSTFVSRVVDALADKLVALSGGRGSPRGMIALALATAYSEDLQIAALVERTVRQKGGVCERVSPTQLSVREGTCFVGQHPVSVLYRYFPTEHFAELPVAEALASVVARGALRTVSSFADMVAQSKVSFARVHAHLNALPPELAQAVASRIPETRLASRAPHVAHERSGWVVKRALGRVGDEVFVGPLETDEDWTRLCLGASDASASGDPWIVQRFVPQRAIQTPWGPRYLTLGAYTMDNEMLGYFARLSPIVHTSHDALVVPVVVRSERAGLS